MTHNCNKERELDLIHADLKEVKQDVKSLLQYKWQIMGGAGVIGFILSFLVSALK